MKRRNTLLVALLATVAVNVTACKTEKLDPTVVMAENLDLVDAIPARWDPLHEKAAATLVALRTMPASDRQAYLQKEWPTLATDIVAQLRMTGRLPGNGADSVVFHFGSGQGVRADDRTAKQHDGFFSNELVAYVYSGKGAPTKVLVRCLNGLFVIDGKELRLERSFVKEPMMRFTIAKGRGPNAYVDYATSIQLAERFNLPIYRGHRRPRKISVAQAQKLADSLKKVMVRVRVFPGDVFDLGSMTYTPKGGKARQATE